MNLSNITTVAAALADPTRLRMLLALEGRAVPAGELAAGVGVVASVGTYHLAKLVEAGLVTTSRRGRQTLVRLRRERWRQVVEALAS
jgi:DNA-binding transcriptional ArsR family regulator